MPSDIEKHAFHIHIDNKVYVVVTRVDGKTSEPGFNAKLGKDEISYFLPYFYGVIHHGDAVEAMAIDIACKVKA